MKRNILRNNLVLAALTATAFALPRPGVAQSASSHPKPKQNIPLNQAWAWGDNTYGQLGDDSMTGSIVPTTVANPNYFRNILIGISALSAGGEHSLALQSGTVYAWGWNVRGQLGNNTNTDSDFPVQVLAGAQGGTYLGDNSAIVSIAAGKAHSLALDSSGQVWAWGDNIDGGALGDGTVTDRWLPVKVIDLPNPIKAIAAPNYGHHSLAVDSNGNVWAWGLNSNGQLGQGGNPDNNAHPIPMKVLAGAQGAIGTYLGDSSKIVAVAAGRYFSLAVDSNGYVWAWGYNYHGELGNNSTTDSSLPVQVLAGAQAAFYGTTNPYLNLNQGSYDGSSTGPKSPVTVSGGHYHSMALDSVGYVWAWGNDYYGQLGDNGGGEFNPVPVSVLTTTDGPIKSISAGGYHGLASDFYGELNAWGLNSSGQLGDGTTTDRYIPELISSITASVVAGGFEHSLAVGNYVFIDSVPWYYFHGVK